MTERLYYNDSYTLVFDAQVLEQTTYNNQPAVVLDRTYFYPLGGGQACDLGTLNGIRVIDVQTREADRAVLHVLEQPLNDSHVEGQIDAERRADYMHHHSGQHILSQALLQAAEAETVSVHMSADSMTIDVKRVNISPEEWQRVEDLANRVVQENRQVQAWFPDADELASLRIRKLPDVAGKVRIVDVGGFDVTACGGTHVAHTGEIGMIKVIRYERRGETTRLEFKCSQRALNDYREKNEIVNRLAAQLTVGYWELPDAITRLQDESKALRVQLKAAREQLVTAESEAFVQAAVEHNDVRIIMQAFDDRDVNDLRLLGQKITANPGTVALIGLAGEKAQLLLGRAENVNVDMAKVLKVALAVLKSDRGGGKPNFAQGGGVAATLQDVQAALKLAEQTVRQELQS